MSSDGCFINPKNVDVVWGKLKKKPNNIAELQSLLDIIGYFRRATSNCSQIAKQLHDMLKTSDLTSRSRQLINSTKEHQSMLDKPLRHVTVPLTLNFHFQLFFILHTNASAKDLGCAFDQIQENQLRVLGYGSRALVAAGNKYHSSKLKFFAFERGHLGTLQALSLLFTTFQGLEWFHLFIHISKSQGYRSTIGKWTV